MPRLKMRKSEKIERRAEGRGQMLAVGGRTRRRPIGRDYAAAKDAEVGIWKCEKIAQGQSV
jgi:hypothetical protein